MSFDKVNITVKKYLLDSNLPLEERNFFNTTNPPVLNNTLDLTSYMLNLGDIQYTYEETEDNIYSMLPSEVSFTVASKKTISDFFELYTNNIYYRYLIELKYSGVLQWKGIIKPDSFKQSFKPSSDSYRLSFTGFGMEKEFSDYFKTKLFEVTATEYPDEFLGINFVNILNLIETTFGLSNVQAESNIGDYKVAMDDVLSNSKSSDNYPYVFIKTGLNNIVDLKETKWDWFKRTLTSMGWVFYFQGDMMYIKNRVSYLGTNTSLGNNLLEFDYSKQYGTQGYNHILIEDSTDSYGGSGLSSFTGGDLTGRSIIGQRAYLFSDLTKNFLYTTPFNSWGVNPLPATSNYIWNFIEDEEVTVFVEDEDLTNVINATVTATCTNLSFVYSGTITGLNQDRILKLDTGKAKGRLSGSTLNGTNIYNPNDKTFPLYTVTDINYGNALYKYNTTTGKYTTYQDYMKSSQASYNFESLLQSKTIKGINAKVKGLLFTSKGSKFYFEGTELQSGDNYAVRSISYDLINEITTLTLEQNV